MDVEGKVTESNSAASCRPVGLCRVMYIHMMWVWYCGPIWSDVPTAPPDTDLTLLAVGTFSFTNTFMLMHVATEA